MTTRLHAAASLHTTATGFDPGFRAGASCFANWFTLAVIAAFATWSMSGVLR